MTVTLPRRATSRGARVAFSFSPITDRAEELLFAGDLCGAVDLLLAFASSRPCEQILGRRSNADESQHDWIEVARVSPVDVARMIVATGLIALMRTENGRDAATLAEAAVDLVAMTGRDRLEAVLEGRERTDRFVAAMKALCQPRRVRG